MKHISTRLISNTRGAALPAFFLLPDTTFLRFCQGGRHQWAPVLRVRSPSDWMIGLNFWSFLTNGFSPKVIRNLRQVLSRRCQELGK